MSIPKEEIEKPLLFNKKKSIYNLKVYNIYNISLNNFYNSLYFENLILIFFYLKMIMKKKI